MTRPRTVQKGITEHFALAPKVPLSIVELEVAFKGVYDTGQIAHAVSALLKSDELEKDGPRRGAMRPDGRMTCVQYYLITPAALAAMAPPDRSLCESVGVDPGRVVEMPFRVTPASVAYLAMQLAITGPRRDRMAHTIRARYGATAITPKPESPPPAPVQLDLSL
ncbi:hypothetical protein DIE14_02410 [Burkholderia sp. Bp9017]|uniref:hypothetical protein n=1 Tax=Burkholderia TaxID=32008 RepID=UPI000F5EC557|nr:MULTISPECIES: hypothetical protein [Burkholderia]RQZ31778.1 hypothetical protein DIE14_02410 [Burkholderia sp. Bp9017]RQZ37910.1 hypothetical protein DIE13_02400 [Burkholderia sp. Bp9016]